MAEFTLTKSWKDLELGRERVILIKKVVYDTKFQKIKITFADEAGGSNVNTFNLLGNNNKPNEIAMGIFSALYKAVFGGKDGDVVDPENLTGHHVIADVVENESINKETGEVRGRFINVVNFKHYDEASDDESDDLFA